MKNIAKFLSLGVFAVSTTLVAHADTLASGAISFADNNSSFSGTSAGGTINFGSTGEIEGVGTAPGNTFSPYFAVSDPGTVTFISSTIYGAQGSVTVLSADPTSGGVQIATITMDNETLTFFVTGETVTTASSTAIQLNGTGYFEEDPCAPASSTCSPTAANLSYDTSAATFSLEASYTGTDPNIIFSLAGDAATVSPAPEPSSLMLLGTGLASAAGMVFRRRRSAIA